jgi:hypothetical protein
MTEEEKAARNARNARIKRAREQIDKLRQRVEGPQLVERVEVFNPTRMLVHAGTNFLEAYIAMLVWNITFRKIVPSLPTLRYRDVLALRAFLVGAYPKPVTPRLWDPTRNKLM